MNILLFVLLSTISCCYAFSFGAPELVCDNMMPIHLTPPQDTELPYNISVDKNEVKGGETVEINIKGVKFKGILVQVRLDSRARGKFILDKDENNFKSISCHGFNNNALTHENNSEKNDEKITWRAPHTRGKYIVYVTLVKSGLIFWTKKPAAQITVF